MPTLVVLSGLPGSGKSTRAKQMVDELGFKRLNRDDLRAMIDNGKWSKSNELNIVKIRNAMISAMMSSGCNIVVDDTNIEGNTVEKLRNLVESHNHLATAFSAKELKNFGHHKYSFEHIHLDTPIEECLRRNALREGSARVPDAAIYRMQKALENKRGQ